jgi:hypothetical protein
MTQTDPTSGVGIGVLKTKVADRPNLSVPSPAIVGQIKQIRPQYAGYNDLALAQLLLKDEKLLNDVTKDIISKGADEVGQQRYKDDPKAFETDFNKIKTGIQSQISQSFMTGTDIKRTIINSTPKINKDLQYRPDSKFKVGTVTENQGIQYADVGFVSAKEESGSRYDTISTGKGDPGGVSYGKFQLSSNAGTLNKFLSDSSFKDQFGSLKPGTEEFNATWKKLSSNKDFQREQDNFITNSHFRPVESLYVQKGIDTSNVGIREAIFSASVQHGLKGNEKIMQGAIKILGDERNPERVVEAIYTSRNNYLNSLTNLDDKTKKSITARYQRELQAVRSLVGESDSNILPPNKMRQTILRSPEKFETFYDSFKKKSTLPAGAVGDEILANVARNNRDFDGAIKEEYMTSFEDELARTHNIPISSEQDPQLYANAFAVWDAYGSEGLTKFINLIQFAPRDRNIREEAWDKRYSDALGWFGTPQMNGVTPQKYIQGFMSSLVLDPPQKNPIAEYNIPKDFNQFTTFGYRPNQSTKRVDRLSDDQFVSNIVDSVYQKRTDRNKTTQDLIGKGKLTLDQIKEDTRKGFGLGYDRLRDDIIYMARNGELNFSLADIGSTIMTNGRYGVNEDLGETFVIDDYQNAPVPVRLGLDIMKMSKEGETSIVRESGNTLIYAPNRAKALGERDTVLGNIFRAVTADKQEAIYDDAGNIVGHRTVADNDGLWGLYNGIVAVNWKIAELATTFIVEPATKAAAYGAKKLGYEETAQQLEYYDDLMDNFDVLNYETKGFGEGLQVSDVTGGLVELAGLFLAAKFTGGAALGGLSRSFSMFNGIKKGVELGNRVAPAMQNVGKFGNISSILGKNNTKLWVGFAGVDALGGENYSLLNSGLLGEDAERYYRNQTQAMRVGLDVMSGLAIGELFDWTLAATATTARRGVFRKGALREGESFAKELVSRTQVGEISRDLSTVLRDIRVGDINEAMSKSAQARLDNVIFREPESLADITVNFVEGTNVFMENLRPEIKAALRKINDTASASWSWTGRLTDEDLERQTDQIYREAIDNTAKRVLSFFETGRRTVDDSLWLQFSNMAEEMAGVSRIRPAVDDGGKPMVFANKAEAVSQTMIRDTNTNIVVSNGRFIQQLEDGQYGVYELENYHWAKDLADSVRRTAMSTVSNERAIDLMSMATGLKKDVPEEYDRLMSLVDGYNGVRTYDQNFDEVVLLGKTPQEEGLFVFRKSDGTMSVGRLAEPRFAEGAQTIRVADDEIIDASTDTVVRGLLPPARTDEQFTSMWLDDSVNKIAKNKSQLIEERGAQAAKPGAPAGYAENVASGLANFAKTTTDFVQKNVADISKNIGVDDIRLLTSKSGAKSRLVAPNSAGKIQEWNPGSSVKKDVLVRYVDSDGLDAYWVSNKKTKLQPSTWVLNEDGSLIRNPDWHRMTENATFERTGATGPVNPTFYKLAENTGGFYKVTTADDPDAVLLNIQKPVAISNEDVVNKKYLDDDYVIENNIDGYYTQIDGVAHYKPVSPFEQVVLDEHLSKNEMRKAGESIVPDVSNTARLATVIVGGLGGSLSTGMFDEEEVSTAGGILGSVLGLLGGGRRGRQVVKNVRNITKPMKDADLSRQMDNAVNNDLLDDAYVRGTELGYAGDATNKKEIKAHDDFTKEVTKLIGEGKKDWLKTKYTQSSFGFLSSIGSTTAQKLRDIMFGVNNKANLYRGIAPNNYESKMGVGSWVADIADGERITLDFITNSEAIVDHAARNGIQITESYAKDKFDEFSAMMLESGGRLFENTTNVKVKDFYDNNPHLVDLHRTLREDERFVEMYKSNRDMLNKVKRDYLSAITRVIKDEIKLINVNEADRKLVVDWANSIIDPNVAPDQRVSFKSFMKSLKERDNVLWARVHKLNRDKADRISHLVDFAERYRSFQEFGDEYYTQMLDPNKIEAARQRFFNTNAARYASEEEMETAFKSSLIQRFKELNGSVSTKGSKRYLFKYNDDIGDIEDVTFDNIDEARAFITRLVQDRTTPDDIAESMFSRITPDVFIKSDVDNLYRIDLDHPAFKDEFGQSYFNDYETAHMDEMLNKYITGVFTKQSNFLDRRRKFILPFDLQLTDQDKWIYRYSQDTGPRIHLLENGISDTTSLRVNYINRIKQEMKGKVAPRKIKEYADRVESIYNMQVGLVRSVMTENTPEGRISAMQDHIKNERLFTTIRNTMFAPFAPSIAILDYFQPRVFGPIISSSQSISEAYKLANRDVEAFSNLVSFAENMGIVARKLELTRADPMGVDDALASGSTKVDNAFRWSQRFSDATARFSVMGSLAKLAGVTYDPKKLGRLRLLSDFYTINTASTTINMYAALLESSALAKAYKEMGMATQTVMNGKTFTRRDIVNKFESFGISRDKIDRFIANSDRFEQMIGDIKAGQSISLDQMDKFPSLYEDLTNIIATTADIYHAKNKMSKPEWWSTPVGKFMSQFSSYAWNFSAQILNNRIYRPIANWMEKYDAAIDPAAKPMKVLQAMATKNYGKLRAWGFTDEAIRDLPLDAWYSVFKGVKAASLGAAVIAGRDLYYDAASAGTLTAAEGVGIDVDEDMYFRRTRRNILKEDGTPYWELDNIEDGWQLFRWTASWAAKSGITGKVGDVFFNPFVETGGISAIAGPAVGYADQLIRSFYKVYDSDLADMPETVLQEFGKNTLRFIPLSNSYGFTDVYKSAIKNLTQDRGGVPNFDMEPAFKIEPIEISDPLGLED